MNCPYVKVTSYADFPQCTLTNSVCPYMYRCTNKLTWLPLASMNSCTYQKQGGVNIPKGAYKVRFKKNGLLYVEYDNKIVTIPYDKEAPEYVYLKKVNGALKIKE